MEKYNDIHTVLLKQYTMLNNSMSITVNNKTIPINFKLYNETIARHGDSINHITQKMNVIIFKLSNNIQLKDMLINTFNNELNLITIKICNEINYALDDGVLEPLEIVKIVISSIESITSMIQNRLQILNTKQKTNKIDIGTPQAVANTMKAILTHYIMTLILIILTILEISNTVSTNDITNILNEVSKYLDVLSFVSDAVDVIKKKTSSCC